MNKRSVAIFTSLGLFSLIMIGGVTQTPMPKPDLTSVVLMHQMFEENISRITPTLIDNSTVVEISKDCVNTTDLPAL